MAARRRCDRCRKPYVAQRANSRFCTPTCRKLAAKDRAAGAEPRPVEAPPAEEPAEPAAVGDTEARTRADLEAIGKLTSAQGAALLVVARRIDGAKFESGSSIAALVKTLDMTLERLGAGARRPDSPVDQDRDEVAERRAARAARGA